MRELDELRPLSLGRLLELWREYREAEDPLERAALCNGRILAECCFFRGRPVYRDEAEALEDLTARQMERLLLRLAEGGGPPSAGPLPDRGGQNLALVAARLQALRGE